MRFVPLVLVMCGCAQSVGFPDPEPQQNSDSDTGVQSPMEAAAPSRMGSHFGDYVLAGGGGGQMVLFVKDDGFVTLTPEDSTATGTGTIDEAGNLSVTTEIDAVAQSPLAFTGVVTFDGASWKATGKVVAPWKSSGSGTWAALRK